MAIGGLTIPFTGGVLLSLRSRFVESNESVAMERSQFDSSGSDFS